MCNRYTGNTHAHMLIGVCTDVCMHIHAVFVAKVGH